MIRMRSHQQDLENVMRADISDKNILLKSRVGLLHEGGRERYNEFQGDEISCNDLGLDEEFTFCKVLN